MDRLLGAAVLTGAALEASVSAEDWRWLAVPITGLVLAGGVLVRRSHPDAVFVSLLIGSAFDVLARVVGVNVSSAAAAAGTLLLLYSLARYGRPPRYLYQLTVVTALSIGLQIWDGDSLRSAAVVIVLVGVVAGVGAGMRLRHTRQVARLERLRRDERAHLARDLHDVIAHCISAIAMRADAGASVAASNPEGARRALEDIHATARESLNDIRQVIGILRDPNAPEGERTTTAPDLRDLMQMTTSTLPSVVVTVPQDLDIVPLAASRALYRIAQEAVTNARRHALDVSVIDVRVERVRTGLRLTVHDDGRPVSLHREGHGLTGMRERVELLGGTISAGRDPYGGWAVKTEVPLRGSAW